MKKIFLCGNTGSVNRGCEAIVRSTAKILPVRGGDIFLATFSPEQDISMARETGINVIPYANYPTAVHRYLCALTRKVFKKSVAGQGIVQKPLFSRIDKNDICLNIGGDTYCYGRPIPSIALNSFTKKNGIKNILWCCSIEEENIKGEILEDLNSYEYIFAREKLTYEALINAGLDKNRVIKVCDPAFFLNMSKIDLPTGFKKGNTVGINVSEMTVNAHNPHAYANLITLIRYILDNTDMSVCLIPHVYSIKDNRNDYPILKKIYNEINSERVSIVDKEYNCEQLKYIISNCRFFVGARTHATIASYSSGVPTLVIGYSVKSKGIATDLFGTYDGYVIPYTELTEKNELVKAFKGIVEKESEIRARLYSFLPEYRQQLSDAVAKYISGKNDTEKPFDICCKEICSGCSACASICPVNAISMKPDSEGFEYPKIDFNKCINCGKCRNICPVANKYKDTEQIPKLYAAVNNNEETRLNSSSGGLFTALAEKVIEDGGVVFGAGFGEHLKVVHKMCGDKNGLSELRGSKYVQSEIGNTYREAKEQLEAGKKVLFVGTPCQIGGLLAYLGKEYENLITADFICHGVPSPKVWEKFVSSKESKYASKAVSASFREKKDGWKPYYMSIKFENADEYSCVIPSDPYLRGFVFALYLRPTCELCSFKLMHRQSDITLADFWGIEKTDSAFNDNKGTSLVMVHSAKGENLFDSVKPSINYNVQGFEFALEDNPSYYKSAKHSILRKQFFNDLNKKPINKAIEKYCGNGIASKLRRKAAKIFIVKK